MSCAYQVSQDVVIALCILALFNNLQEKITGDMENEMSGIQSRTVREV